MRRQRCLCPVRRTIICAPSPPPAPDYAGAAAAQGQANKEAAIASSKLNNPNVVNPYGTQKWTEGAPGRTFDQNAYQTSLDSWNQARANLTPDADGNMPNIGEAPNAQDFWVTSDIGRPTLTQEFSPEQKALYDKNVKTQGILGDIGITGAQSLNQVIGKNLDLSGAPQVGSYDELRKGLLGSMAARADEDYGLQRDKANSDLIAAGIRPGTKAYQDRMQAIERSRNDARTQAEVNAGNMVNQAFNTDTQRRKDAIAEMLTQRQTPLNEINALLSGSQVANPFAVPGAAQNANVQPAPIFGATQAQSGYDQSVHQGEVAGANSKMQGGMAAAATVAAAMI